MILLQSRRGTITAYIAYTKEHWALILSLSSATMYLCIARCCLGFSVLIYRIRMMIVDIVEYTALPQYNTVKVNVNALIKTVYKC